MLSARLWVAVLLLSSALVDEARGAPSAPNPTISIKIERLRLRNGLEVVLHPDPRSTRVVVNLLYRVGSAHEPPGRRGLAHLFEHLMFMGTRRVPHKQIDAIMEGAGGWNNAYTTEDVTVYYDVGPAGLLETMLWIEADRMASLPAALTRRKLARQLKVVLAERRQNYVDAPYGVSGLLLPGLTFPKRHPYSWPVIGMEADLRAAKVSELKRFFRRHYSPRNASLVIAGGFHVARTRSLVRRYFEWIPSAAPPPKLVPAATSFPPRRLEVEDRVRLPRLTLVWRSPRRFAGGDAEAELLATILASGKRSRLHRALLLRRLLAVDVAAYQDGRRLAGQFVIEVTLRKGASRRRVARIVMAEVRRLLRHGVEERELRRARSRLETAFLVRLQRPRHRADLLNTYVAFAGRADFLRQDLARYRRVRRTDLVHHARGILGRRPQATLWIVPGAKAKRASSRPASPSTSRVLVSRGAPASAPAHPQVSPPPLMKRRPALGPLRLPKAPSIQVGRLSNGIPVYLVPKRDLPLLQLRALVHTGLVDDAARRPGVAYLTAELLDEGAGKRGTLAFAGALDELGARLRSTCSYHTTAVSLRLLARHAKAGAALLADVLRRPRLSRRSLQRARGELRSWALQRRADPHALADLALARAVFGGQLYGRPRLPLPTSLGRRLSPRAVATFHRRTYRPERVTLLATGAVSMAELLRVLEPRFGRWRARGPRRSSRPAASSRGAPKRGPRLVLVDVPGASQAVVRVGGLSPGWRGGRGLADVAAMRLLALILGGSFTSRLNQNLRERHGLSYGAEASFVLRHRLGLLRISSAVSAKHAVRAVEQVLLEVDKLSRKRVGRLELDKAKRLFIEARGARSESVGALMTMAERLVRYGLPLQSDARLGTLVRGLDASALLRSARRLLRPKRLTIVVAGDLKRIEAGLVRRFGAARRYGADGLP